MRTFLSCGFALFLLGAGLLPLLLFLYSFFGRYHFTAELMVSCRLQLMLLLIPPACFLIYRRKFWLGLVYGLAIAWCGLDILPIYLPASQPPAGNKQISILAFNVFNQSSDPRFDAETIEQYDADILVVTEFTRDWYKILGSLKFKYSHQVLQPRWHGYGIGIFSKFPIEKEHIESLSNVADIPMLDVHFKIGNRQLRVGGLHTVSPVSQPRMELRDQQIKKIFEYFSKSEVPTVILGDFNAVPWTHSMEMHERLGFRDSRQGFGYHASWNQKIPFLKIPIDHVFVSKDIHVHGREIGYSEGSDHLPILITVSISDEVSR